MGSVKARQGAKADGRGGRLVKQPNFKRKSRINLNSNDIHTETAATIMDVLDNGDAIMLATTLGGGAVRLVLFQGDDKSSTVCTTAEELLEGLAAIRDIYAGSYEPGADG